MSEPTDDEARDWRDLVQSPGWARLKAYAEQEWNAVAFERHVTLALDGADPLALGKLRQIVQAKKAVFDLIRHAESRVRQVIVDKTPHIGRSNAL